MKLLSLFWSMNKSLEQTQFTGNNQIFDLDNTYIQFKIKLQ